MLLWLAVLRMHPWELGPARVSSRLSLWDTFACSCSVASLGVVSPLVLIIVSLKGGTSLLLDDENEPNQLVPQALKGMRSPAFLPMFYPVEHKVHYLQGKNAITKLAPIPTLQMLPNLDRCSGAFTVLKGFWAASQVQVLVSTVASHSQVLPQLGNRGIWMQAAKPRGSGRHHRRNFSAWQPEKPDKNSTGKINPPSTPLPPSPFPPPHTELSITSCLLSFWFVCVWNSETWGLFGSCEWEMTTLLIDLSFWSYHHSFLLGRECEALVNNIGLCISLSPIVCCLLHAVLF